jgi:O-antigen/teichoic acid export membrane protein
MLNKSITDRIARLAKEGGWVFFGQLSSMLGLIISIKILTNYLSPAIYGDVAIGLTIATFINQVLFGPISAGVLRMYSEAHHRQAIGEYYGGALYIANQAAKFLFCLTIFSVLVLYFFASYSDVLTFFLSIGLSIAAGYGAVFSAIQTGGRRRAVVSIHQGLEPMLRMVLIILLIQLLDGGSQVVLLAYFSSNVVLSLSQYYFLGKNESQVIKPSLKEKIWAKKIWKFSLPMSIFGVFTAIQLLSDKWSLQLFDSPFEVGLYAVVFQLGYFPIQALSGLVTQFLTPILYHRYGNAKVDSAAKEAEKINIFFSNTILMTTVICFFVTTFFHDELFSLLTSSFYYSGSRYLPWMVLSSGFFAAGQTLSLNLMASMNTKRLMYAKISTAVVAVILNIVGAYYLGLNGVVFASLVFSILFYLSIALSNRNVRQI